MRSMVVLAALLILWIGGNHYVAHWLMHALERQHKPLNHETATAEVVVILGGATRWQVPPRALPEVNELGDRLIYATYLYREGLATQIVVSGGWLTWQTDGTYGNSEAADMNQLLQLMGVPAEAIWQEDRSVNTYENGVYTQELLAEKGINKIMLVTSASHMPRAVAIFEKQGFEVIPAPTDFFVTEMVDSGGDGRIDWGNLLYHSIPQAEYLEVTSRALKEYIGLVVYRTRGWL